MILPVIQPLSPYTMLRQVSEAQCLQGIVSLTWKETENALPQILQLMKSAPSHSNVIVILPQDSISVSTTGYPNPTSNPLGSNNIESMPAAQPNVGNFPCQCQVQDVHSVSGARVSRTWAGSSSYMSTCSLPKNQSPRFEGTPNMRL